MVPPLIRLWESTVQCTYIRYYLLVIPQDMVTGQCTQWVGTTNQDMVTSHWSVVSVGGHN